MRSNKKRKHLGLDNYWESASFNRQIFFNFRDQIMNLALARFRWENLPATCDARFLEYILLTQGMATIAFPQKQKGIFYSTQVVQKGKLNIYDNPTAWRSIGNNGWNFYANNNSGVIVWDNMTRYPLFPKIDIYALELADLMITRRNNRQHQKVPFVLTGPQEKELDMINLYKQVAGGEPAVIANSSLSQIDISAINTQVPFIGKELNEDMQNVWRSVFQMLGISNMPFKTERQIEDEVQNQEDATIKARLTYLKCRRKAADTLNKRFKQYLKKPIEVYWDNDNISDNFNLLENIETQANLELIDIKGEDNGTDSTLSDTRQ
ncbi:MAG: hypothetical protein K2G60_06720 [Oscillospiraceae bacterium]|nr:hypothetical protein [Oscillospiraceae bacterium]